MNSGGEPALGPYLRRWDLRADGAPMRTATGVVQFVRRSGERLALKLVTQDDETGQAAILAHYSGEGSVRLIEHDGPALLMERAFPGAPLSQLVEQGRDDEATGVVCDVIARLHGRPLPAGRIRAVEDWGQGFDRIRLQALAAGADPGLIDRGRSLYRDLCATQGPRRLLHGDLHHDNILRDEARGWLAVDPKGVLGEAAYETGAMLRNPGLDPRLYADPAIIARRAAILAERLELDPRRILGWCFAQAVLSALWWVEDGGDPSRAWLVARATLPLL